MNAYPVIAWDNLLNQDPAPTVTAPAAAPGSPLENVWDWRDYTYYQPAGSGEIAIKFDADPLPGDEMTVDALALAGHNLGSAGVTGLTLKYSDDDATYHDCLDPIDPPDDRVLFRRFAEKTHRYFKLVIPTGYVETPRIGVLFIGVAMEIPSYPDAGFDPDRQEAVQRAEYSREGRLLGVAASYRRRSIVAGFKRLPPAFIAESAVPFFERHGDRPFFFAWDHAGHPDQAYLVRLAAPKLEAPYDGASRGLILDMSGPAE